MYKDDFKDNIENYKRVTGQLDGQGHKIDTNTESNGRFHTDWLNMMYPRLRLARNLLSDDGVIFISIDDNEQENLKKICDEVFGADNFICEFVIASNSAKNNSKFVSITQEYLMCYAKNKELVLSGWAVKKTNIDEFVKIANRLMNSTNDMQEVHSELLSLVKYPKYYEFDHYTYVDNRGPFRASDLTAPSSKTRYDVIHPKTKKPCKTGTRGWAYSYDEMSKLIENDYVFFGEDETTMPQLKNYLFENANSLPKSIVFFDSQSSTKWIKQENLAFDFPKSIDFIKYIISVYPKNDFIILDFFSGSATTAHAVMQLNAEEIHTGGWYGQPQIHHGATSRAYRRKQRGGESGL